MNTLCSKEKKFTHVEKRDIWVFTAEQEEKLSIC